MGNILRQSLQRSGLLERGYKVLRLSLQSRWHFDSLKPFPRMRLRVCDGGIMIGPPKCNSRSFRGRVGGSCKWISVGESISRSRDGTPALILGAPTMLGPRKTFLRRDIFTVVCFDFGGIFPSFLGCSVPVRQCWSLYQKPVSDRQEYILGRSKVTPFFFLQMRVPAGGKVWRKCAKHK